MAPVEIVLDASTAMHGRMGDVEAMVVAREFVRALREELAAGGPPPAVGLRVFGADAPKSERNCRDTRLAVRPGDDEADFAAALAGLQPTGTSPLAFALQTALADTARAYVLVTASADACGGDSCAVWQDAVRVRTNRGARIHVVAVGVPPQDAERLKCLSRAGSGAFLTLGDRAEVPATARRLALVLRNEGRVDVRLSVGEETFAAPVRLLVPRTRRVVAAFNARGPRAVPAGIYDLVVETAPSLPVQRIMVLPGETVTVERSDFGRLEVEVRDPADRPVRVPLTVHAPGRRSEVRYAATGESLILLAGTYDVSVDLGDSIAARRGVAVNAGRSTRVAMGGRGTLLVVSPEFPDPPLTRAILTRGAAVDTLAVGAPRTVATGRFRLRVETLPVFVSDDVSVATGETTTVELPPLGLLRVVIGGTEGPIPGQPASVLEPQTLERYGAMSSGEPRLVMPGVYRVDIATVPSHTVVDVTVRPGEETVVERRGYARIAVTPAEGVAGPFRLEVLRDAAGPRLAERSGSAPVVAAQPGTYFARVWRGSALLWEGRVTVAPDKPARIDLPRP